MVENKIDFAPLKIYPDNNIIISLEKGSITMDQIEKLIGERGQDRNMFIYSLAHIYETGTISGYNNFSKEELIEKRLSFISSLTENCYYHQGADKKLYAEIRSPIEAYKDIEDFPDKAKFEKFHVTLNCETINAFNLKR